MRLPEGRLDFRIKGGCAKVTTDELTGIMFFLQEPTLSNTYLVNPPRGGVLLKGHLLEIPSHLDTLICT